MTDFEALFETLITIGAIKNAEKNPLMMKIIVIFGKYGLTLVSGFNLMKELERALSEDKEI